MGFLNKGHRRDRAANVVAAGAPTNADAHSAYWRERYTAQPTYHADYGWDDYEPAYRYGYQTYPKYRGRDFDGVENELERAWESTKGASRLAWHEAKYAVRDAWHYVERMLPGDFDNDGR